MTIDDLIADLEELRGVYGGDMEVVVARWRKDRPDKYDIIHDPEICSLSYPDERTILGIGDIFPPEGGGEPLRRIA